jgi:hypothetical protein
LEVPVVLLGVWGLWKFFGKGRKFWSGGGASESGGFLKIIFVCVLASTMTLPYIWFVLRPYFDARTYVFYAESFVVVAEAVVYAVLLEWPADGFGRGFRCGLKKFATAFVISLAANLVSYFVGRWVM